MQNSGNPLVLVGIIALFAVAAIAIIVSAVRRREEAFEGIVIDKDIQENIAQDQMPRQTGVISFGNNTGVTHTYRVKVKTDSGKEINYRISEGLYETIKIGDRVNKPKGTTTLTVVASAPVSTAQPQPQPPQNDVNTSPPPTTLGSGTPPTLIS